MGNDSFAFTFNIGNYRCCAIRDGDDGNRNILLVKTGQHQVLIDTGVGRDLHPRLPALLLDRLQAVGTPSTAIDVVILSHADWDHIGGMADESGNPAFPNARLVLARDEWAFWSQQPERLPPSEAYDEAFRQGYGIPQTRLAQLRDRLELVADGAEVVPGIRIMAAPGHTLGYAVIEVTSGRERLLFVGDLLYAPEDVENPDFVSMFDYDPVQVVATRRRVLGQAAREQPLLMAYHLPFPGLGHVVQQGAGWRWQSAEVSK
jgi:glyoxylase-like metal-dependent hydrolase (beta-lactamase superfamily II)